MCGRYVTQQDIEEMEEIITLLENIHGKGAISSGEIFPTNNAPVITAENHTKRPVLMTWGFLPYKGPGVIINARAETAPKKRTFQRALCENRCVIPSTGFFEWSHRDKRPKEKYLFTLPDSPMLYMAGLFTEMEEGLARYVILTTAANSSMRDIHDRMPVVLQKDELDEWLFDPKGTLHYLMRTPPELLRQKT